MQRLLTAAVGVPLALLAVFRLPGPWFFLLVLLIIELAAVEYVRIGRRWAPRSPLGALFLLVPLAALAMSPELVPMAGTASGSASLLGAALLLSVGLGSLVLLARAPVEEGMSALGILAFGLPYFALPVASLYRLQRSDPWLLCLLLAIVWLGDSAAYYCGSLWGRLRLAPRVSPRKTWEGALAHFAAALLVATLWSWWRLDRLSGSLLLLAALLSVAGQLGDLVESLIKRGAGVKDSGNLLPGHGGLLDRLDALLFAAPVMLLGVQLVGSGVLGP